MQPQPNMELYITSILAAGDSSSISYSLGYWLAVIGTSSCEWVFFYRIHLGPFLVATFLLFRWGISVGFSASIQCPLPVSTDSECQTVNEVFSSRPFFLPTSPLSCQSGLPVKEVFSSSMHIPVGNGGFLLFILGIGNRESAPLGDRHLALIPGIEWSLPGRLLDWFPASKPTCI